MVILMLQSGFYVLEMNVRCIAWLVGRGMEERDNTPAEAPKHIRSY